MTKNLPTLCSLAKNTQPDLALGHNESISYIQHAHDHELKDQQCDIERERAKSQLTRFRGHFILDKCREHTSGNQEQSLLEASIKCSDLEDPCPVIDGGRKSKASGSSRYRIRLEYEFDPAVDQPMEHGSSVVKMVSPSEADGSSTILAELKPVLRNIVNQLVQKHHIKSTGIETSRETKQCYSHGRSQSADSLELNTTLGIINKAQFSQAGGIHESQNALAADHMSGTADQVHQHFHPEVIAKDNIPSPVIADYHIAWKEHQPGVRMISAPFECNPWLSLDNEMKSLHSGTTNKPHPPGDCMGVDTPVLPVGCPARDEDSQFNSDSECKSPSPTSIDVCRRTGTMCLSQQALIDRFVPVTDHKEIPWSCLRNISITFERSVCSARRVFDGAVCIPIMRNPLCTFHLNRSVTVIIEQASSSVEIASSTHSELKSIGRDPTKRLNENMALFTVDFNVPLLQSYPDQHTTSPLILATSRISESRVVEISTHSSRPTHRGTLYSRSLDRLSQARSYGVPPFVTPSAIHNIILPLNSINYCRNNERAIKSARANLLSISDISRSPKARRNQFSNKHRERHIKPNINRKTHARIKPISVSETPQEGIVIIPLNRTDAPKFSAIEDFGSELSNALGWNNNSTCCKAERIIFCPYTRPNCVCWYRRASSVESCSRRPKRHRTVVHRHCSCSCRRRHRQRVHHCHRPVSLDSERIFLCDVRCKPRHRGCGYEWHLPGDSKFQSECHCTAPTTASTKQQPGEASMVYLDLYPGHYALHKCTCTAKQPNEESEEAPKDETSRPASDPLPELPVHTENNSAVIGGRQQLDQAVFVDCEWSHDLGHLFIKRVSSDADLDDVNDVLLCGDSRLKPLCTCIKSFSCVCPSVRSPKAAKRAEPDWKHSRASQAKSSVILEVPLLFNANRPSQRKPTHVNTGIKNFPRFRIHLPDSGTKILRASRAYRLVANHRGFHLTGQMQSVRAFNTIRKSKSRNTSSLRKRLSFRRYRLMPRSKSRKSVCSSSGAPTEYSLRNPRDFKSYHVPIVMSCTSPARNCLADKGNLHFCFPSPDSMATLHSKLARNNVQLPEARVRSDLHRRDYSVVCPVVVGDFPTGTGDDASQPPEKNSPTVLELVTHRKSCTPVDYHCYYSSRSDRPQSVIERDLNPIDSITGKPNCSMVSEEKQLATIREISTDLQPCDILMDIQPQMHLPSGRRNGTAFDGSVLDILDTAVKLSSGHLRQSREHVTGTALEKLEDINLAETAYEAQSSDSIALVEHIDVTPSFKGNIMPSSPARNSQRTITNRTHFANQIYRGAASSSSERTDDGMTYSSSRSQYLKQAHVGTHATLVEHELAELTDQRNQQQPLVQSGETLNPRPMEVCTFVRPAVLPEDRSTECIITADETSGSVDYIAFARRKYRTGQISGLSSDSSTQLSTPTDAHAFEQWSFISPTSPLFWAGNCSPQFSRIKTDQAQSTRHGQSYMTTTDLIQCRSTSPMIRTENELSFLEAEILSQSPLVGDSDCPTEEPSTELDAFLKPQSDASEPPDTVTVHAQTETSLSKASNLVDESIGPSAGAKRKVNRGPLGTTSSVWKSQKIRSLTPSAKSTILDTAITVNNGGKSVSSAPGSAWYIRTLMSRDDTIRRPYESTGALSENAFSDIQNKSKESEGLRSTVVCSQLETNIDRNSRLLGSWLRHRPNDPLAGQMAKATSISGSNVAKRVMALRPPHKSQLMSSRSHERPYSNVFDTNNSNSSLFNSGDSWIDGNILSPRISMSVGTTHCCEVNTVPQVHLSPTSSASLPRRQSRNIPVELSELCKTTSKAPNLGRKVDGWQLAEENNFQLIITGKEDTRLSKSSQECQPATVSDSYYTVGDLTPEMVSADPYAKDMPDLEESSCSVRLDGFDQASTDSSCLFMNSTTSKSAPSYFWYLNGSDETLWYPYKDIFDLTRAHDGLDNGEDSSEILSEEQRDPGSLSCNTFQSLNADTDYSELTSNSTRNAYEPVSDSGFSQMNDSDGTMSTQFMLPHNAEGCAMIKKPEYRSVCDEFQFESAHFAINSTERADPCVYGDQHSGSIDLGGQWKNNFSPSRSIQGESIICEVTTKQSSTTTLDNRADDSTSLTEITVPCETVRKLCIKKTQFVVPEISIEIDSSTPMRHTQELIYSTECLNMNRVANSSPANKPQPCACRWFRRSLNLIPTVDFFIALKRISPDCFSNALTWNGTLTEQKLSILMVLNTHTAQSMYYQTVPQNIDALLRFEKLGQPSTIDDSQPGTYHVITQDLTLPRCYGQPKQRFGLQLRVKGFSKNYATIDWIDAWPQGQVIEQPWYPKPLMWQSRMDCFPGDITKKTNEQQSFRTPTHSQQAPDLLRTLKHVHPNLKMVRSRKRSSSVIILPGETLSTGWKSCGIPRSRRGAASSVSNRYITPSSTELGSFGLSSDTSLPPRHNSSPKVCKLKIRKAVKTRRRTSHGSSHCVFKRTCQIHHWLSSGEPGFTRHKNDLYRRHKQSVSVSPKSVSSTDFFEVIERLHRKKELSKPTLKRRTVNVACQTLR